MTDRTWYIAKADTGEQFGPYGDGELRTFLRDGRVAAADSLWCDGMAEWKSARPFLWFATQPSASAPDPETEEPEIAGPNGGQDMFTAETAGGPIEPEVYGRLRGHAKGLALTITADDLTAFVDRNPKPYLKYRDRLVAKQGKVWFSFSWAGFLVPLAWLAYRRFYGWLAGMVGLAVLSVVLPSLFPVLDKVFQNTGAIISAVVAVNAKPMLIERAQKAVDEADSRGLAGNDRRALLFARGRVSYWAAGIMALFHLAIYGFLAFLIYGLVAR